RRPADRGAVRPASRSTAGAQSGCGAGAPRDPDPAAGALGLYAESTAMTVAEPHVTPLEVPVMLRRGTIFLVSLTAVGAAAALAPTGGGKAGAVPEYRPVAGWPAQPGDVKFSQVTGVATDAADRVYVFHRGKQPLAVFDRD